jgi:hypothetical protein
VEGKRVQIARMYIQCCANQKCAMTSTCLFSPPQLGVYSKKKHRGQSWKVAVSEIWDVRVYKPPSVFSQPPFFILRSCLDFQNWSSTCGRLFLFLLSKRVSEVCDGVSDDLSFTKNSAKETAWTIQNQKARLV